MPSACMMLQMLLLVGLLEELHEAPSCMISLGAFTGNCSANGVSEKAKGYWQSFPCPGLRTHFSSDRLELFDLVESGFHWFETLI